MHATPPHDVKHLNNVKHRQLDGSLFLSQDELNEIQQNLRTTVTKTLPTSDAKFETHDDVSDTTRQLTSHEKSQMSLRLTGIILTEKKTWVIWLNDTEYSNENSNVENGLYKILDVNIDHVNLICRRTGKKFFLTIGQTLHRNFV